MLVRDDLPELGSDLVAALASLDVDDLISRMVVELVEWS
jgi:hypothetical protein